MSTKKQAQSWASPNVVPDKGDLFELEGKDAAPKMIDPSLLAPIGPLVKEYSGDDEAAIVQSILYKETVIPTDPSKYKCAARFIPGATIGGKVGPVTKRKVMIIGKIPSYDYISPPGSEGAEMGLNIATPLQKLLGAGAGILLGVLKDAGISPKEYNDFYVTNVIRFPRIDANHKKPPPAAWVKECRHYLEQELYLIQPDVILCLGTEASKSITKVAVTKAQGHVYKVNVTESKKAQVVCAYDPRMVLDKFEHRPMLLAAASLFSRVLHGEAVNSVGDQNFYYVDNEEELSIIVDELIKDNITDFAVDCEWGGGQHYLDPRAQLRTIQVGWSGNDAMVIILHREGMSEAFNPYISSALGQLRRLLCRPEVRIVGHNFAADFGWLHEYGLDLAGQFYFDTMLASHLFEPTASHDLDSLAVRMLSGWRRHDGPLQEWKSKNSSLVTDETAYGHIPDEILHPYGASDACATYLLYKHYDAKLLTQQHSRLNRLFRQLVMPATLAFVEIERNGAYMDRERLIQMEAQYKNKYMELLGAFKDKIEQPYFNPNSSKQRVELLYTKLGLTPVKTTGKYPIMWDEVVADGTAHLHSPATDDETLGMLSSASDVAKALQNICLISTVRKSFLTPKVLSSSGVMDYKKGLIGFIKRDGRLHPQISQMVKTGRLAAHDPNLMNMPAAQEAAMQLAGGGEIHRMRSAFTVESGHLMVCADYSQAEIATLAYLSGDPVLIKSVEDKKDIHSVVAKEMFKLDCEIDEVKKLFKHLRVSAKAILFGLIYGRGAKAISREVEKAGVPCSQEDAQGFIDRFFEKFPLVKKFIDTIQKQVEEKLYVETLWGRKEYFYKIEGDRGDIAARQKRQGVNFLVQSYVADLLRLALVNLQQYRREHGMKFKVILTVHDSIMLEVPIDEVEEVATVVLPYCMTEAAKAPDLGFTVRVDVDVIQRWDVDMYLEELMALGLPEEFSMKFCVLDDDGNPKRRSND